MKINLNNIPYDILDKIIEYLDVNQTINFLMSSKDIYYSYRPNKHFEIVMINKIKMYFNSLRKIEFDFQHINVHEVYTCLNKVYYYFNKHRDTLLSDMLIYLCDLKLSDTFLFQHIISHCYFSKTGEHVYNAILADDLLYLLMYSENTKDITKYIFIDAIILLHAIKYKISSKDKNGILALFNYLLFKHFFRTSEYVEDIITDIMCEVIKIGDMSILDELYKKQTFYKFKLNYQKLVRSCIEQNNITILEAINIKLKDQNDYLRERNLTIKPLLITKESVRYLMKRKSYKMLSRVIELYLMELINMNGYINEIVHNFDYDDIHCMELIRYMNPKNRLKIKRK